uniref:Uncharacterized protein n=1 Tax=Musa acuminata subsp. malaccensis TaxID=214687 RepID=A0A804JIS5_MUSAM|nr:PREDICTED: golgin subfamily B member 1-like isoform X6 [Musa acuminata subsp. malaccensis]
MAEELQGSSGYIEVKLSEEANIDVAEDENQSLRSDSTDLLGKEGKKEEEEESASDGEFIKVEKEILADVEERSHLLNPMVEVEETSHNANHRSDSSEAHADSIKMKEKNKELELQLETVLGKLKSSEVEKALLISEFDLANDKLEKMTKHCEELELGHKLMKNQILEAEQIYNLQLESLEEALKASYIKDKELTDARESFIELSTELDSSRKRMKALEEELLSSVSKVHKLEELNKHSSLQAESESKNVLELQMMLDLAHANAKEMEGQVNDLQMELKELHNENAEKQHVEEALQSTLLELSISQEKLEISESQVAKLEQELASKDHFICGLSEELNLYKVSQEQLRADVAELENMLSTSREDLETKLVNLQELELKLQEQVKEREADEACFKNQEVQISSLQNDLSELTREKATLESTVTDLNTKLLENEETHSQLEMKINLADQDLKKTDSLLSQALSYKEELNKKMELLEQLYHESRITAEVSAKRNLELEGLVQSSNAAEESIRKQLKESEMKLASSEKKNMELEQQINLAEIKRLDAESEINKLNEKIMELTADNALSRSCLESFEDRIGQLESSLSQSSLRNSELEKELNDLLRKCAEHEERATATHLRSIELEDMIHSSHSRAEDSKKRAGELELLLEATNSRTKELEQLLSTIEEKHRDVEALSKQYSSKVSGLVTELEATHQAANDKERELTDILYVVVEDRKKFEDLSNNQEKKLYESENEIQILKNELKYLKEKVASVQEDLEASSDRERELLEILKYDGEQLEHHSKALEDLTAKNLELNSLNESLIKDSQLKLQEAAASIKQKEMEAKELLEKLNFLEEQLISYKDDAVEATENVALLKVELGENAIKLVSLENNVEELNRKVSEANLRTQQKFAENELLSMENSKLREELEAHQQKVNELDEFSKSIHAEKEATVEKLISHASTITELTDERSKCLEIQFATESRLKENEAQLQEAIEKYKQRDLEARDQYEKLLAFETHLRTYEEQVSESAVITSTQKHKLEEAHFKLQDMEGLVEKLESKLDQLKTENEGLARHNLSLTEELATYETKMNELHVAFDAAVAKKEDVSMELHSFKKETEDLLQLLNSDKEKLQSQITSVMEEHNTCNEMYQNARKELKAAIAQLEEKLSEQKARELSFDSLVESLKAELSEKSTMQSELEQRLKYAGEQLEHHREAVEELTARNFELNSLNETLVKNSELKLEEAATSFMQKESEVKRLLEMLKSLEEQLAFYKEQAVGAAENVASLKTQLEASTMKLVSLENNVEELKQKVSESNLTCEQTLSENELLATSNSKLREELEDHQHKVNDFNELLKSIHAEKEAAVEQLASHASTIAKLTDEHSRGLELQHAAESRIEENEAQLYEAIEKHKKKDLEARNLYEKLLSLETQLRNDEQASEPDVAATQKGILEEAHFKLQEVEGLVEQLKSKLDQFKIENEDLSKDNVGLTEMLAIYESKLNMVQVALDTAVREKEDIIMQLHSSRKELEDIIQSHINDKEKLQSQVTSLMEENNMHNEMHQNVRKELEAAIAQLDERLSEKKSELEQRLRHAGEQVELHRKDVEEFAARNLELNSLNESLIKDSELKLEQAAASILQKESETKELLDKLKYLEDQSTFYKEQAVEATENVTSLKAELGTNALILVSLENNVQELKQKVSEANLKGEQTLAENELLATSNSKLLEELEAHQDKVNELEELLKSIHAEKEAADKKLASHASTIAKLTDEHSQGLELQYTTELRLKENEEQLHEAIEKHKKRDLEARDLYEKLLALESQLKTCEEQASESDILTATQKSKLEEAHFKLQEHEGLIEQLQSSLAQFKTENEDLSRDNLSLTEELATYETKMNLLQAALHEATAEKEDTLMQLHSSTKQLEDMMQLHMSDKEKLQLQITSVMEENNMHKGMHHNARKELEAAIAQLEEKLSEQKAREFSFDSLVESLKAELSEKSLMQSDMEKKLIHAGEQLEHHRNAVEELTARNSELNSLNESLIKDSELKLEQAAANILQKDFEVKELLEKIKSLEEQSSFYKEQAIEANENVNSLKAELGANAKTLVSLENNYEELKQQISEANLKHEQTLAENELLATSNSNHREELEAHQQKVIELNEFLKSIHTEKEAAVEQLTSHATTIAKLTEEHSRGLELQFATEFRLKENETQLHEAIEKHKQRDFEAKDLYEKLLALESQLKSYEEQASESAIVAATQKSKLDEAHCKLQEHEGLVEHLYSRLAQFKTENEDLSRDNVSLSEKLATYETKLNELQVEFDTAIIEKEDIIMRLHSSNKELEDIMQSHMSDKEKLQLQINFVMEENNMHDKMHQNARKELEATIAQLEEKLSEQKSDLEQKLRHAEEQLEHHRQAVEELAARNMELSSLNESLIKDSELKLELSAANILQKESEVKELLEKLKSLEEQSSFYKEQAIEATETVASLKAELGVNAKTLVSLENKVEELKQHISEANLKHEQTLAENELLATSNSKLREELEAHQQKVSELNEVLKSIHTEKEAAVEQLASHASTIAKLTEEHSRGLELQFATEFRLKENEAQLREAIEKQKQRDLEARDLYEKQLALESQLKSYEEQASESAIFEATQKSELEEAHFKLQEHEGLVQQLKSTLDQFKTENEDLSRENLSLTVELATLKTKMNELQVALEASVAAKENIFLQLHSSKKEMEDLMQLLISDKEKLQLQITSIMAESNMRNEMHNDARKELEETIVQLTQNLSEQKAREFTLDSLVESLKSDLSEKSLMQSELEQKLRYAGEQLEHHKEAVDELTTRNLELNSLNESLLKNSELKLEQAAKSIMQKESEAKELLNKLKSLEEQSAFYKEQAVQATENVASLEAELGANAMALVSLETNVEELKQKVSEANLKGEQTRAENELLVRSNSMLMEELKSHQHKVNELEELLKFIQAEKEASVEQLVSHANTIAQLTDEHSRGLELQLATEYRLKENEAQLHEAIDKHKQIDFEARDLSEKLLALESQLNAYEEQAIESAVIATTHKGKLEEAHFKLQELEELVQQLESKLDQFKTENDFLSRDNLSLTEELATYKTKINELKVAHEAAVTDKEDIFVQLHSSKKEMEDHMQLLLSDKEKLQSQITSVMEENNLHNEMHQNARKELKETIAQLEEKISEQMERESSLDSLVEILKSELSTKFLMQSELEQKFRYAGEQLEHYKKAVEELMTRNLELNSLNESLFKDSELKLEQADACIIQKESEANELLEKLRSVEEQSAFYREQAVKATENVASLKAELGVNVMKLISLENIVEELKQKVSEANLKGEQTFAENELLATSNSKLREELESHQNKLNELKEFLEFIHAEKEFAVEQLASHASTIAQMSDEHSRDLELQLATECSLKENEAQLHEVIEKHKQRDLEARDLYEKLLALETQLRAYEEQASESAVVAATQKGKLEEAHFKLQELEGLVEQLKSQLDQFKIKNEDLLRDNLSLSENLAMYAMNMNELQVALDAAVTQKEDIFMQLCSSKKEMEELMQLHSSDKEKLQSQITSVLVENNMCNEMYHNARKELEATLAQFQEQLSEQKTRESSLVSLVESLKAELSGKSLMQSELEQNLRYAGEQLEHHRNALEKLTTRNLEQLRQADATIMQKESEAEELLEKLKSAEEQLASQKGKLEEAHSKLQELEGLVEQLKSMSDQFKTENEDLSRDNLSLTEEIATNKTRMNGLQLALDATVTEKEDIFMQLHSSQKNMEDLMQLHISDKEKLQSQITSVMEENKKCNKMHQNSRKELEATVSKLEEKLSEQKAREFSLDSLAESLKAELSEKSLMQSELEQKLRYAEEQLGHHRKAVEELTARNLELNSLNESLIKDTELKLEQVAASILQKESETKELLEKLKSLEEQSTFYKEQLVEATQTVTLLEAELGANALTLVSLENNIQELKQKVSEANLKGEQTLSENELLATSNLELREELEAHQHKVNELNEVLKSIHAEKEAVNEQLASHASIIAKLTDEHSQGLELLFATEVCLKENEAQLHEAIEKHKQRDLEDRDLNEKLFALEYQLKNYEEQASELAIVAATQKSNLEEAHFKLQEYEGLVEQLYCRLAQFKTENEDLSRDNLSLTEDLATYETKMSKFQEALDEATAEKEDIFMQLHSSMKEMDDVKQLLISDKEKLQSQITSVMEENIMLHEMYQNMRRELETTVQLKEEPTKEKAREFPLNSLVGNLEAELAEKSLMQARISELEHKLLLAEKTYIQEIESLVSAAAEKEAVLTAKLKDHTSLLQERDSLDKKLKEILKELDLAQRTITEQKELISTKEFEMQASMKQTLDALWSKNQDAALLEKQVEELKQRLQEAKTQNKEKVIEQSKKLTLVNVELHEMRLKLSKTTQMERKIAELENALLLAYATSGQEVKNETSHAELKDAIEVFSRDCGLDTSTLLKRKIKISDRVHQDTRTTDADPNVHDDTEPLVAMALKFILGVALVSMIVGIILGKRY